MAKWKSVLVTREIKNGDGSIATAGETVWIPENEAAKGHRLVERAIQLGKYKPAAANEMETVQETLRGREKEDLKRKGLLPRDSK